MNDTKPWWQSKTILTSIVGAVVAIGLALGILPEGFDSTPIVGGILAVTSVLAIIFRRKAKAAIVPTLAP